MNLKACIDLLMVEPKLSENVKRFIFANIDSAELLDVLLLMNADRSRLWTPDKLGHELRTSTKSVTNRLLRLEMLGMVVSTGSETLEYFCKPQNKELDDIVNELADCNTLIRHKILQLIFSPLKQGRIIADGFLVKSKKFDNGDSNG